MGVELPHSTVAVADGPAQRRDDAGNGVATKRCVGVEGRPPCGEAIAAVRTRCEPCAALHRKLKRQAYNRNNYRASQDARKQRRRDGYRAKQDNRDLELAILYAIWEIEREERAKARGSFSYSFTRYENLPHDLRQSPPPPTRFRGMCTQRRERIMGKVPLIKKHIRQRALVKEYKRRKALPPTGAPRDSVWGTLVDGVMYSTFALNEALDRRSPYDPPRRPPPLPWRWSAAAAGTTGTRPRLRTTARGSRSGAAKRTGRRRRGRPRLTEAAKLTRRIERAAALYVRVENGGQPYAAAWYDTHEGSTATPANAARAARREVAWLVKKYPPGTWSAPLPRVARGAPPPPPSAA